MIGPDPNGSALPVSPSRHRILTIVLRGVSLEVPEGSIVALLGPNGAGKTTTLRVITGLLRIHEGHVTKGELRWQGELPNRASLFLCAGPFRPSRPARWTQMVFYTVLTIGEQPSARPFATVAVSSDGGRSFGFRSMPCRVGQLTAKATIE